MGAALKKYLTDEAKRIRREVASMERRAARGETGLDTIIRIYRYDAMKMDEELAEIEAAA